MISWPANTNWPYYIIKIKFDNIKMTYKSFQGHYVGGGKEFKKMLQIGRSYISVLTS